MEDYRCWNKHRE
jgi:hypothetical protein